MVIYRLIVKSVITSLLIILLLLNSNVFAENTINTDEIFDSSISEISETLELESFTNIIDETIKSSELNEIVDVDKVTSDMLNQESIIDPSTFLGEVISLLFKELYTAIMSSIDIMIIVVIIAILKTFESGNDSNVIAIANFVCYISISALLLRNFTEVLIMFEESISSISLIMQISSPFLMGILMLTGSITAIGVIQPILLFITSAISFLITSVVIPLLVISVAFNIVHSLNENIGLSRLSKFSLNSSLWIVGIALTIFLGILSLETTVTTSVDSLAIKATSSAVSNFVPVVGKFVSDSFTAVVGATKIVGNIGGVLGIIAIIVIAIIPIIKIVCISIVYSIIRSNSRADMQRR